MANLETIVCGIAAHRFGISSLHPWQTNAILSTLEGRDTFVVQPTGKGKSLCFVIPPLCNDKTAVIISPTTISLMTDQVGKLNKKGIRAVQLGSTQKENILQQVKDGDYYPSPPRNHFLIEPQGCLRGSFWTWRLRQARSQGGFGGFDRTPLLDQSWHTTSTISQNRASMQAKERDLRVS